MEAFSQRLLAWYRVNGRHDLPWQSLPTPYRVWVSEIMLQQTQVTTVIPYYQRFMARFPEISVLAYADINEVLHLWSGLGYYARARNLHKTARIITEQYQGRFPSSLESLMDLPGIGRSTAGAILALACNLPFPVLDGNVKRLLTRYFAIPGWPGNSRVEKKLWSIAEGLTPVEKVAEYTQAIMDLGATVCQRTAPDCCACPLNSDCLAHEQQLQHKYPFPKPKKVLPLRNTIFLILRNTAGKFLLQQRPDTGIWGGLWSFIECSDKENVERLIADQLYFDVSGLTYLEDFRHSFTHYHLVIRPVTGLVTRGHDHIAETKDLCWYDPEADKKLGLPTPVNNLIKQIQLKENMDGTYHTLRKTG